MVSSDFPHQHQDRQSTSVLVLDARRERDAELPKPKAHASYSQGERKDGPGCKSGRVWIRKSFRANRCHNATPWCFAAWVLYVRSGLLYVSTSCSDVSCAFGLGAEFVAPNPGVNDSISAEGSGFSSLAVSSWGRHSQINTSMIMMMMMMMMMMMIMMICLCEG